jgi:hypothetical protein
MFSREKHTSLLHLSVKSFPWGQFRQHLVRCFFQSFLWQTDFGKKCKIMAAVAKFITTNIQKNFIAMEQHV